MLFHVTATHTVDDCPGYHHEKMPAILECPGAENNYSLANFLLESLRFQQDFKVTPVQPLAETIAMAKEMMARAGG